MYKMQFTNIYIHYPGGPGSAINLYCVCVCVWMFGQQLQN